MSDEDKLTNVPTADLLGLEVESSHQRLVKLREKNERTDRRSQGIIFSENFQVTAEQDAADKELVKQTYSEVENISSLSEEPCSQEDGRKTTADDSASTIPSLDDIENKYMDIAQFKIFQLAGDDVMGRPVIAFCACRLPIKDLIDHQRLLQFVKLTLDHYVVNDYTLIYFHYGLSSHNKPSFNWLLQVYRELDRKYKKNIKAFYVVHPSNFIRVAYAIMSPFLSKKFGKKIHHITRLDDLAPFVHLGQLDIPKEVRDHDEELIAKSKVKPGSSNMSSFYISTEIPTTQQFGVSLRWLIENNGADPIPIVLKTCVNFLREHGLQTEGIFRRSPLNTTVQELKKEFNLGIKVNLDPSDVHAPAVLIKRFLREMPEPLLTFEFYDVAMDICTLNQQERAERMRNELRRFLPQENYLVLTYVIDFLEQVVDHSAENKMSTGNLAIIFGPNLIWSKNDTTSLTTMAKVNTFTKSLLDHSRDILDDRSILNSCK